MKWLAALFILVLVVAGSIFYLSQRETAPVVTITKPDRVVGQKGTLTVDIGGQPGATLKSVEIRVEQNGQVTPLIGADGTAPVTIGLGPLTISQPFGKQAVPQLKAGPARIVVSATRKSFLNLRTLTTTATKDIQVRLEPPRISVVSTHHYVNHGGSEFVVYRATPDDIVSGVRVGDVEYPGYPAGVADPAVKGAFFALL